jgi:hypothetical protein
MLNKIIAMLNQATDEIKEEKIEKEFERDEWLEFYEKQKNGVRFVKQFCTREEEYKLSEAFESLRHELYTD